MAEETTVVRIKVSTKEKLDKIGKKTDTYDSIIEKLLQKT